MKKMISLLIIFTMILSSISLSMADSENIDDKLIEKGFTLGMIETMTDEMKLSALESEVEITIVEFDEQAKIEEFLLKSEEELEEMGYTLNEILKVHKEIEEGKIGIAGTIPSSKLQINMWSSTLPTRPIDYKISVTYDWIQSPYIHGKDYLAFAWSGNHYLSQSESMFNITYISDQDGSKTYDVLSSTESPLNAGAYFNLNMRDSSLNRWAKSGSGFIRVWKNTSQGEMGKAMFKYGHRIVEIVGGGVDITGTPSIFFGSGYDESPAKYVDLPY